MQMLRRGTGPVAPAYNTSHEQVQRFRSRRHRPSGILSRTLLATLVAATLGISTAQAASFGHSRIVSAPGQPLVLEIPVTQLTQPEIESLRATPAPAEAWADAGMTPPVPLDSMRLVLLDGHRPGVKVIQLRSSHAVEQPIVDVLIDVRSATGQQRYQVSLVVHADTQAIQPPGLPGTGVKVIDGKGSLGSSGQGFAGRRIVVPPGDNLHAIARRNAVEGVSVYQMMIALHRSNPQAFIHDNINLVKAGATLTLPGMDVLTAISDKEARRIYLQHAEAFYRHRQKGVNAEAVSAFSVPAVAEGEIRPPEPARAAATTVAEPAGSSDILRLSEPRPTQSGAAGAGGAAQPSSSSLHGQAGATGNGILSGGVAGVANNTGAAGNDAGSLQAAAGTMVATSGSHAASRPVSGAQGNGAPSGSDAASGGNGARAGTASLHPDDATAQSKGVAESRSRILELEDNVRNLNRALQKQGHVAAEAALEGAKSVTEVIKEVISLVDTEGEGQTSPGTEASGAAESSRVAETSGAKEGSGVEEAHGAAATASGTSAGGTAAAAGTAGAGEHGKSTNSSATGVGNRSIGASSGGTAAGGPATAAGSVGTPSSAVDRGTTAAPASGDATGSHAAGSSVAGGQSWFAQNMMWLIGAGVALIVLIIAWLLRRASVAREAVHQQADSPITDSMLQARLREIDLDLDHPPPSDRRGSRA